ncbi:MAG: TldD/PmbA family protein [Candidatus Aenigmarchaeota archaeon]|nr:TldD/PmbA family protein [Candidatus Aenigmarchaeota archaeon]
MLDLAKKTLRYAEKFSDYTEVRFENLKTNRVIVKNGNLEATEVNKIFGISIRVLKNGFLGFVSTNNLKFSNLKKQVNKALKLANYSKNILKKPVKLSEEKAFKDKYNVKEKIKLENISLEEKINKVFEIEKALIKTKIKLPIRLLEYSDEIKEKTFINSEGSLIQSKVPRISFDYVITFISNGSSEQRVFQFGGVGSWELLRQWKLKQKILEEAKTLPKIAKAKKLPKDKYDVILSPELTGIASHESCGHPYEADRILGREAAQAGKSFVKKDMLGQKIGSEVVSVVDDPTIPNSYGFYLYDDEGIKARRRFLIKNGIINAFLQNRETAAEFGIASNGSSRAKAYFSEPIVRMANTFVLPGDYSFEELLETIKKGVYIKSYMEWNIDDKRYNQKYTGLESYLIKNGKITKLIKAPTLEITTPAFWSSIDAVGKKLDFAAGSCGKSDPMQPMPVWFGGPDIRLRNIFLV